MSAIETARLKIKSFFSSKSGKASIVGFLVAAVLFAIIYVTLPSSSEEHKNGKACTRWNSKGYHDGEEVTRFDEKAAPGGTWQWPECAEKCGEQKPGKCEFWTLTATAPRTCLLKLKIEGDPFHGGDGYVEGPYVRDCVQGKHWSLMARLGITVALVIPIAALLALIYIAYERGWYWRLWRYLFGGGRQWTTIEDLQHGPRGTIRASIELSSNFGKLFGDDGKLVSKLVDEEIEEGEEQRKMQLQYEELKKQARELEEHRRKLGEAVDEEPDESQETDLQKKQREIEEEAERVRRDMEMNPEERWNVAGDIGDDVEVGEEPLSPETTQSARKKLTQRHGFAAQDTEKAQAEAKARMAKKKEKKEGVDDEGKFTLNLKRVDGKEFGLKYGPGLIVTSIQADSVVSEWNARNPQNAVKEGDKVTSVNAITANGEMLKLLRSKAEGELEIIFFRNSA